MSDSGSDLEEGNIFQKARLVSPQKRPRSDNGPPSKHIRPDPANTAADLHTISLSPKLATNWTSEKQHEIDKESESTEIRMEETERVDGDVLVEKSVEIAATRSGEESEESEVAEAPFTPELELGDYSSDFTSDAGSEPANPVQKPLSLHSRTIEELAATLPYVEIPLVEATESPLIGIDPSRTRADKIKASNIADAVQDLRKKILKTTHRLNALRSVPISVPQNDDDPDDLIRQLWTTGSQLGRLAGLKLDAKRLKQTRTDLMNGIAEYSSSTGANKASVIAYDQLKFQVAEARQALDRNKEDHQSLDDTRAEVAALRERCVKLSSEYLAAQDNYKTLARRSRAAPVQEDQLEPLEQDIRDSCTRFGAKVVFDPAYVVVKMMHMDIYLTTTAKQFEFSYPKILEPVYQHYRHLVVDLPINDAMRLWDRCLRVKNEFSAMLPLGPGKFTTRDNVLVYEQTHLDRQRRVFVEINGTRIKVGELPTDLRDLPALVNLSKLSI